MADALPRRPCKRHRRGAGVYSAMNHIKRLEQDRAELVALRAELRELRGYLASAKFAEDPTVQVRDVLNRLYEAEGRAVDMREVQPS